MFADGHGRIDQNHLFTTEMKGNLKLKKGDIVRYSMRKISDDVYNICRILSVEDECWSLEAFLDGEDCASKKTEANKMAIETFDKWIHGTIIKKQSGDLTIQIPGENFDAIEVAINDIDW